MKRTVIIAFILLAVVAWYVFYTQAERRRIIEKITERLGAIQGLHEKTTEELKAMLKSLQI